MDRMKGSKIRTETYKDEVVFISERAPRINTEVGRFRFSLKKSCQKLKGENPSAEKGLKIRNKDSLLTKTLWTRLPTRVTDFLTRRFCL